MDANQPPKSTESPQVEQLLTQLHNAEELPGAVNFAEGDVRLKSGLDSDRAQDRSIRQIAELAPVILDVFDLASGRSSYISRDVVNLHGYTADEITQMTKPLPVLLYPEDLPRLTARLERLKLLADDEVDEIEYRVMSRGGEWRWVMSRNTPLSRDERGAVRQVVGVTVDITERKRAEDALRRAHQELEQRVAERTRQLTAVNTALAEEIADRKRAEAELRRSEAYLAGAQRLSHTGSWVWNVSSGNLFWSLEHFRICGLDPETFKPTIEAAQELIHPQDRAAAQEAFYRATNAGEEFDANFRLVCPDGTVRHVHSRAHPVFNQAGELTEYVGAVVDVTDRKHTEDELRRSEARLAEGQRLTHTGTWGWTLSDGSIYWSQEQFRIFGRDPQQGAPSVDDAFQSIHPDDRDYVQQTFETLLREPKDYQAGCRVVTPNGTVKHVHTTAHPVFEAGILTEVFGTTIDVTDRTRAEEERTRLLHRVISAHEDERLRISREIHDEVGQQLSVLRLKVSTLKEDCAGQAEIRAQIESIEGVLRQLDSDVDFLVWNLRPTALDELGLLVVISNVIAHWTKHFGTHAELHTVGMEQRRVTSDVGVVLYRVLQEALNNVAKHAIARNVHIFLERRAGHVSLIVEDDGKGFETEQVLNTSKGLGLIGMRERAALLGGTLEIESHPARGTTLVVQIPLSGVSTSEEHDG